MGQHAHFCAHVIVSNLLEASASGLILVSCPDPTPKRGKGSGEFGHNPWARERNLSAPMRLQLYLSHMTRQPQEFKAPLPCCINLNCRPARSRANDQSDSRFVSLPQCRRAPTEPAKPRKRSKFTRPLSPFLGWGLGTRLG